MATDERENYGLERQRKRPAQFHRGDIVAVTDAVAKAVAPMFRGRIVDRFTIVQIVTRGAAATLRGPYGVEIHVPLSQLTLLERPSDGAKVATPLLTIPEVQRALTASDPKEKPERNWVKADPNQTISSGDQEYMASLLAAIAAYQERGGIGDWLPWVMDRTIGSEKKFYAMIRKYLPRILDALGEREGSYQTAEYRPSGGGAFGREYSGVRSKYVKPKIMFRRNFKEAGEPDEAEDLFGKEASREPRKKDLHAQLAALVPNEDYLLAGEQFWCVVYTPPKPFSGDPPYLAAWLDENGDLRTATRKTEAAAIKLAQSSWGA